MDEPVWGPEWDLYDEPIGKLVPVISDVAVEGTDLTLAVETPRNDVWLSEERDGIRRHYAVKQSSVCVRRIGTTWVLVGSLAEWPGVRTVRLELDLPLTAFFQSDAGWLALAPPDAGTASGKLSWEDEHGRVRATVELPPLFEMLDTGPTFYGPPLP